MKSAEQKTVLVTGANRGIGFEVCKELGEHGFNVFLSARNTETGNEAVQKLKDLSITVDFIQMDVSNEVSIKNAAIEFKKFSLPLNVLINNAAILEDTNDIAKMPTSELRNAINTNSIGAFVVIREFLPFMISGSRIINVSSGAGALADMGSYAPAYSISKTTLNAITRQFAAALRSKNIVVNSVCPGWVKTDMGGFGAPRSLKKGVETIIWLATDVPSDKTGLFWRDKKVIDW